MFERFDQDARTLVMHASEHARRLGHRYIGGEHLLPAGAQQRRPGRAPGPAQAPPPPAAPGGARLAPPAPCAARGDPRPLPAGELIRGPVHEPRNRVVSSPTAAAVAGCALSRHQTRRTRDWPAR